MNQNQNQNHFVHEDSGIQEKIIEILQWSFIPVGPYLWYFGPFRILILDQTEYFIIFTGSSFQEFELKPISLLISKFFKFISTSAIFSPPTPLQSVDDQSDATQRWCRGPYWKWQFGRRSPNSIFGQFPSPKSSSSFSLQKWRENIYYSGYPRRHTATRWQY